MKVVEHNGKFLLTALLIVFGVMFLASCNKVSTEARASTGEAQAKAATTTTRIGDPYPLTTCPVTGNTLGEMGEPIIYDFDGREIRFCCENCISKFEADPYTYINQIDEQIIAEQMPYYPMDACPVTNQPLGGEMGEPIDVVIDNRLVRFCCEACVSKFKKDPAKYFSVLDDAVTKAQLADYPLTTCPVTGEKLGEMGDPINYVFGNRLIRFCCKGCIKEFEADPAKYMSKLN